MKTYTLTLDNADLRALIHAATVLVLETIKIKKKTGNRSAEALHMEFDCRRLQILIDQIDWEEFENYEKRMESNKQLYH